MIDTAITLFGRSGYQRVSTREIATGAGVNPPILQYYFQSKNGLYYACVERVCRTIAARLDPVLAKAREALSSQASPDDVIEAVNLIQDCLVDAFYAHDEGPSIRRLVDAEDDLPETRNARQLMRDRVNLPIFRTVSALIGKVLGRPSDDLETGLHAFAIFGGVMAFHLDETRLKDAIGWSEPDLDSIRLLKVILRRQTSLVLTGLYQASD